VLAFAFPFLRLKAISIFFLFARVRGRLTITMKPHPRIRTTIKWGGAAVTVVLVVVWIASEFWSFGLGGPPGRAAYFSDGMFLWGKAYSVAGGADWGIDAFPVPLWLPAVAMLILTAIAWRVDARARHSQGDVCAKCHYDRAGLAKGAVCPECGSEPGGRAARRPAS
jgi:hypothetical protein